MEWAILVLDKPRYFSSLHANWTFVSTEVLGDRSHRDGSAIDPYMYTYIYILIIYVYKSYVYTYTYTYTYTHTDIYI